MPSDALSRVLAALSGVKPDSAGQYLAFCPAHPDGSKHGRQSLRLAEGNGGRVILNCFAGCTTDAVVKAAGLRISDLFSNWTPPRARRKIEATYDYEDEEGRLRYQAVRWTPKSFSLRHLSDLGEWVSGMDGVQPILYRLPALVNAPPTTTIWLTEGEKHADRLAEAGLVASCNPMGAGKWRSDYSPYLSGRPVVILQDNDQPGYRHAHQVASAIAAVAASVRVLLLPGLPAKGDVLDWLASGRTIEQLEQIAAETPEWRQEDADPRDEIDADEDDLPALAKRAWAAIQRYNNPPALFIRDGVPVQMVRQGDGSTPYFSELSRKEDWGYHLARAARFYREGKKDRTYLDPPERVTRDMASERQPPLPSIRRVVETPTFAPDGRLVQQHGYDADAGYWLEMPDGLEMPDVPDRPTDEDLADAVGVFSDLVCDFPFEGIADRANALGLFLLPLVRDMIDGPTPLHLVDASTPGSGKSWLVHALLLPSLGRHPTVITEAKDEDEWRKRITSALSQGRSVLWIDNVNRTLDSAHLASVLTSTEWSDRRLGTSTMAQYANRSIWVATGNNVDLSSEMVRRVVRIRLQPDMERPWERPGNTFRHPDLLDWAQQHRAELVWAGAVMVRHWLASGRPKVTQPSMGSFERWQSIVGSIVTHAGQPGFIENRSDLYETTDTGHAAMREFTERWREQYGPAPVGVAMLYEIANTVDGLQIYGRDDHARRTSLGRLLRSQRGVVIGEFRLELAYRKSKNAAQWQLTRVKPLIVPEDDEGF